MGDESSSGEEHVTSMLLPISAIDFMPINSTSAASPVPHHPDRKQPSHACPACPWQTRYQDDVGRNHIPTQIIPVRNSRDDASSQAETVPGCVWVGNLFEGGVYDARAPLSFP